MLDFSNCFKLFGAFVCICLLIFYQNGQSNWIPKVFEAEFDENPKVEAISKKKFNFFNKSKNVELPIVLFYTTFFGSNLMHNFLSENEKIIDCPVQCQFTSDKNLYSEAKVAIFHYLDMPNINFDLIKTQRNPKTFNVFYMLESPLTEPLRSDYQPSLNFFNLTMTYRRDSDFFLPYDTFLPITNATTPSEKWSNSEVVTKISKKKKLAVAFVSNCFAKSGRHFLLDQLKKILGEELTIFGTCFGNFQCKKSSNNRENCMNSAIDEHYFYFAFENSICQDYVTEKFWNIKKLIVPVVLERKVISNLVEDNYFLAVDDYENLTDFTNNLQEISKNYTKYKKYFSWTKKYKKSKESSNLAKKISCEICKFAHQNLTKIIPDISKYWNNEKCAKETGIKSISDVFVMFRSLKNLAGEFFYGKNG